MTQTAILEQPCSIHDFDLVLDGDELLGRMVVALTPLSEINEEGDELPVSPYTRGSICDIIGEPGALRVKISWANLALTSHPVSEFGAVLDLATNLR
jgi:hypothetical protein